MAGEITGGAIVTPSLCLSTLASQPIFQLIAQQRSQFHITSKEKGLLRNNHPRVKRKQADDI